MSGFIAGAVHPSRTYALGQLAPNMQSTRLACTGTRRRFKRKALATAHTGFARRLVGKVGNRCGRAAVKGQRWAGMMLHRV